MASTTSHRTGIHYNCTDLEDIRLNTNWEDVTCPICLDSPHNSVLLHCSSSNKGCRSFICDTNNTHSNCLNRFKSAYGFPTNGSSGQISPVIPSCPNSRLACPLCRGDVTGWIVIDEARMHLDLKKRCCEVKQCSYVGDFTELQEHAQLKHPHSRPSEIDPAQQLDWENFQQSSEIVDVLSTIHAEVPHGVVLGDYVIEYGGEENGEDEYEDFRGREGNWWTSCIFYKVFGSFKASRNRRRSRGSSTRRGRRRSSSDEGSTTSVDISEYRFDETDDEFVGPSGGPGSVASRGITSPHSRRRRSRF